MESLSSSLKSRQNIDVKTSFNESVKDVSLDIPNVSKLDRSKVQNIINDKYIECGNYIKDKYGFKSEYVYLNTKYFNFGIDKNNVSAISNAGDITFKNFVYYNNTNEERNLKYDEYVLCNKFDSILKDIKRMSFDIKYYIDEMMHQLHSK